MSEVENQLSREDQLLLKEYELSQEMHNYYGRIMWQMGSIFIGGGLAAIALIISRTSPPSALPTFAAIIFTIVMSGYYFVVRRYRNISEIHLRRCRQIENQLGLEQHRYVRLATESEITIDDETVEDDRTIRIPFPTGWGTIQWLIRLLIIVTWFTAIVFLIHPDFWDTLAREFLGDCIIQSLKSTLLNGAALL